MSLEPLPAANTGAEATHAKIADLSYRNYDGPLQSRTLRWLTVARAVIRLNVRKKMFSIPLLCILLFYILFGAQVYMDPSGMTNYQATFNGFVDEYTSAFYHAMTGTAFFVFLIALACGGGSIASDNRANALLIYLSKPITRSDYLIGKWAGVFTLVGSAAFAPALALYVFFLGTYYDKSFFGNNPWLLLKVATATLLLAAINTSIVIGFSAVTKNPRTANVLYAGFYLILSLIISVVIGNQLHLQRFERENAAHLNRYTTAGPNMQIELAPEKPSSEFLEQAQPQLNMAATAQYLDVAGIANGVALHLYKAKPPYYRMMELNLQPMLQPLLLLAAFFIIFPLIVARYSIKAVEIIRG
jgi:ABC-2 type transport system permease protein